MKATSSNCQQLPVHSVVQAVIVGVPCEQSLMASCMLQHSSLRRQSFAVSEAVKVACDAG